MEKFAAKSICILGRQPALGLAELESIYGSEHVRGLGEHALLDIAAEQINFKSLGGTVKVARLLTTLPNDNWESAYKYLVDKIPEHLQRVSESKFTLGVSLYGLGLSVPKLNADLLALKKKIKHMTGRSVRVVPNKALALNSAQILHNGLTKKGAWELILVSYGGRFYLAQSLFVQDIQAYAARDQTRPARDARVGMLPPKLAQIMINLATGQLGRQADNKTLIRILDPFCGTGVILQEALLMGYSVMGTDIESRMVEYSQKNIRWLFDEYPRLQGQVDIETADATNYQWPVFGTITSEVFLGRPLTSLPTEDKLKQKVSDVNLITKKFLKNLQPQLRSGRSVCIAVPAWRKPNGQFIKLPLIDQLTDMGYNYWDLKTVRRDELLYYREYQVVARQLLRLNKADK
jgi:tRNA G10  N-methylase Trm11